MVESKKAVEDYLRDIKYSVACGKYVISLRPKNEQLDTDYIISEQKKKKIILSLQIGDFSHILQNEHKGFEHETLYVFGKTVELIERFGNSKQAIPLYIKFNKIKNKFVIVISFHIQEHLLSYPFAKTINTGTLSNCE